MQLKAIEQKVKKPYGMRLSETEKRFMQSLADKYTQGDLSKWIRYAALHYRPSKAELAKTS